MPATPSRPERTVAVVLGVVGIAVFVLMGVTVGAVTFIGTEPDRDAGPRFTPVGAPPEVEDDDRDEPDDPPEPRFETIPMPSGDDLEDDFYDDPYEDDPYEDDPYEVPDEGEDPFEEPLPDPTADALVLVTESLEADSWVISDEYLMGPDEPVASSPCAPEGWNTGALDRAIGTYADLDEMGPEAAITVTLSSYQTEELAAADLERARTPEYQECEVSQRQQMSRLDQDVEVTVLDEEPTAPGVAIAMTETGGEGRVEYDHIIVVGRMRAQLDVCSCAGFDELYLRWVADDIAWAMAEVQGLPAPG
jgi:hypothetical protein